MHRFLGFELPSFFQWMLLMCGGLALLQFVHVSVPLEYHLQPVQSAAQQRVLKQHLLLSQCRLKQHLQRCDKTGLTIMSFLKNGMETFMIFSANKIFQVLLYLNESDAFRDPDVLVCFCLVWAVWTQDHLLLTCCKCRVCAMSSFTCSVWQGLGIS